MRNRAFNHLLVRNDQGEEGNRLSRPRRHLEYAVSLLEVVATAFVRSGGTVTVASRVRLRSHI